eukprot:TRINITY_DN2889_c0_g2_i1.p1 TRINITY_DN2889_c0_g2~~TRINITY_DN2889_c0_g2_i1.p1  ORF type:complete len:184 (+),score=63.86 TRINITY_DN2889_c0_g2_i1:31-552(+)
MSFNFKSSGFSLTPKPKSRKAKRNEISEEQKNEIKDAFELFDIDKTGSIGYHELKVAMKALGLDAKRAEVVRIIEEYDRDGSSTINLQDFTEVMSQKIAERDPKEFMMTAFNLFDQDGTGAISLSNLRHVARELGHNIPDEELQAMIDEFDKDEDGVINEEEFFRIMEMSNAY